ncbi:ribokinase [Salinicola avicenniae]|uniref:ribokinase n=1 Tax=Salinicola avicenniae TaxID=2916836 RepID=UPI0020738FAE|nr:MULTISPECIES: ribokinase [unclassified Salinicola]
MRPTRDHAPVYNYGSINIDYVYRVPHLVQPGETLASASFCRVLGGKGANQSLALARADGQVSHWGRLAQADRWALEPLEAAGVDIAQIALTDDPSGHALIQVDDAAENAIILYPGANHGFTESDLEKLVGGAEPGGWLLMQNECNAPASILRLAAARGLAIAFNPAPLTPEVSELPLTLCQTLFLNRGEAAALAERAPDASADALLEALTGRLPDVEIVLTLGSDGVHYRHADCHIEVAAHRVKAVDTTAAGDTFIGYFMAARQRDANVEHALRLATTASALCVQVAGAAPSIPPMADVEAALRSMPTLALTRHSTT